MSHEIRTPVNAVVGLSHLLLKTELNKDQKEYVRRIQSASCSLVNIINDTLDFSKMEAGKLQLESVVFQVDRVLEDVADLVTLEAQHKGLDLYFMADWRIPGELIGDPLRLGQIITNLTTNAIKFTEKGEIIVSTRLVAIHESSVILQFSVKDSGIGLTEEQRTEIFQAFAQADRSTTRKYGGTGLGLTISQRLVAMMDGDLIVNSTLGEGSEFAFTATFGIQSGSEAEPLKLKDHYHVLVYEQSPTSRKMIEQALPPDSFRLTFADDGQAVINFLEQKQGKNGKSSYDFILLDWNTDKSNSFQLFKYLTYSSIATGIPFMVMVDFFQIKTAALRELLQANAVLTKPLQASRLVSALLRVLQPDGPNPLPDSLLHRELHPAADIDEERYSRILIVEDNELSRLVYQELFDSHFEQVVLAEDGNTAVEAVRTSPVPFDVILMDVEMADLDGYEAARLIRKYDQEVPIIAHTAHINVPEEQKREAGMNGFLAKPTAPEQLIAAVKRWAAAAKQGKNSEQAFTRESLSTKSSSSVSPPKEALVRTDVLLQRLHGNHTLVCRVLKVFLKEYADYMTKIRRCIDQHDYPALKRHIHNLKGVAGNLSFDSLFHFLQEFEQVVKQMEEMQLHARVNELAVLLESVRNEVADWIKKTDPEQQETSTTK
ncbi:hybrid sensor histidine kinase/response regulator [Paenibacillus senegalensis]|uniref:hybrid sensor histidine kinase/response regulator n=1 Tax=Paenibacillus senegalensis TaxID=1465766 RepID=UPI000289752E|nr:hybrid sensor histidine kinase/response regulator [Paenibacillus senegalensis]